LTDNEKRILVSVFGNELDYGKIRVHIGGVFTVLGYSRGIGNKICVIKKDIEKDGQVNEDTLIHEAAHVWQYNNRMGFRYATRALRQHGIKAIIDILPGGLSYNPYAYKHLIEKGIPWDIWPPEAQADWIMKNKRLPTKEMYEGDGKARKDVLLRRWLRY
jgi:hypothetical protein